jgi:hypothetical protein
MSGGGFLACLRCRAQSSKRQLLRCCCFCLDRRSLLLLMLGLTTRLIARFAPGQFRRGDQRRLLAHDTSHVAVEINTRRTRPQRKQIIAVAGVNAQRKTQSGFRKNPAARMSS